MVRRSSCNGMLSLGVCAAVLGMAPDAAAEPIRLHGTAAAARALGGHQEDEFGWGVAGLVAGELVLAPQIGVELELGSVWLSEAGRPADPRIAAEGDASALTGAVGLRLHPFAGTGGGDGFWLAAAGGLSTTGSEARTGARTRGMFDAQLGWDFLTAGGRFGAGPMLGYLHVFQPDSEFRPADASIVLIGVHAFYGSVDDKPDGDRDGDGIPDSRDGCPDEPEDIDQFEDYDGCPDIDNDKDGVADSVDRCINVPEDRDGFEDEDGCPELDNDKDGLPDAKDKCPNDPEDKDGVLDEDGCPDKDNDSDGILDLDDICPNEPETKNGYADQDGCPDEEQVRVLGDKILLDDRVHFRTNSHEIRPISYPLLARLAKLIKAHPEYIHIDIEGHADERGPEWYNLKLSQNRARAVLDFLVLHGVTARRLSSQGFGQSRPLVDKSSEHAWLMNRRVEFRVTRQTKQTTRTSKGPTIPPPDAPAGESSPPPPPPAKDKKKGGADDKDDVEAGPEPSGGG